MVSLLSSTNVVHLIPSVSGAFAPTSSKWFCHWADDRWGEIWQGPLTAIIGRGTMKWNEVYAEEIIPQGCSPVGALPIFSLCQAFISSICSENNSAALQSSPFVANRLLQPATYRRSTSCCLKENALTEPSSNSRSKKRRCSHKTNMSLLLPLSMHSSAPPVIFGPKSSATTSIIQRTLFWFQWNIRRTSLSAASNRCTSSNCCNWKMMFILLVHGWWHEPIPHCFIVKRRDYVSVP